MFKFARAFNQPIHTQQVTVNSNTYTAWDVSNATNIHSMFYMASDFNQDIRNWDVSNVTIFDWMFQFATKMLGPPLNAPSTSAASPHQSWFNQ